MLPLVVYSLVMPAGLLIGCLLKRSKKTCSRLLFVYISYDSCWTVANGSLNPDLSFLDNVHLVEQRNLKLAESIFSSVENCNDVPCNNQKTFLMSCKMAVSFKLNNSDFPPLSFSTVSKPVSFVPVSLSFATACRSSRYASALSHKPLSDSTNVCDGTVCSSSVYPSKPIHPSKPVCLRNVRPSKPTISSNFYLSKSVCPRNVSFSRSIRSSDVCQSRSNVCPSKPVCPSNVYSSTPVCLSNDCQSKPVSPITVCLENLRFVIKTLIFNLFLILLFFSTYFEISTVTSNIFIIIIIIIILSLLLYFKNLDYISIRNYIMRLDIRYIS